MPISFSRRRLVAAGALAVAAAAALPAAASAQEPATVLPDMVQQVPSKLTVKKSVTSKSKVRWTLNMRAAVVNAGPGALILRGGGPEVAPAKYAASQLVNVATGFGIVEGQFGEIPNASFVRYEPDAIHNHWHVVNDLKVSLRRGGKVVRNSSVYEYGGCPGSRYQAIQGVKFAAMPADLQDQCSEGVPGSITTVGIQAGFGDDYGFAANAPAQTLDLTRLKAGTYSLSHIFNPARTIRETTYANNSASLRLRVSWPNGFDRRPALKVLKRCTAKSVCV